MHNFFLLILKAFIITSFISLCFFIISHFIMGDIHVSSFMSHTRFDNGLVDRVLLNTQHYKVWIKGKVEQSRERTSSLLYTSMQLLMKREPSGHLWRRSPTLLIYIYIYIYIWRVNKYTYIYIDIDVSYNSVCTC